MAYWLLKSEPDVFSVDDLAHGTKPEPWDGVRNYQARNFMRDQMQPDDLAFFYHSNTKQPAIVGIMRIVTAGYPDHSAWQADHPYFDPKSAPDNPRWYRVDVAFERRLTRPITLQELKTYAASHLAGLPLLARGNRLSVMPVNDQQWQFILALETKHGC